MHLDAACSPDWGRLNRYVVHTKKTVSSYIASHACVLITNIKRSKSQKKFVILIVGKWKDSKIKSDYILNDSNNATMRDYYDSSNQLGKLNNTDQ